MNDTITIVGNIATDPEQKTLPSGVTVTNFRVASGTRRLDRQTNTWGDGPTNWYRVSAFRALGDNAAASFRKGERVIVAGRLRLRAWESDGKRGMDAEIDADALGHDLLFGVSRYERTHAKAASSDGQTPPDAEAGAAATHDAWATPGASLASEQTPERELVEELVAGATPF